MFSFYPKVIPGEALTSYLLRTAIGNGTDVITLLNNFKTRQEHQYQRIDITNLDFYAPSTFDLDQFSVTFGLNHNAFHSMTFYNALTKFTVPDQIHSARFLNRSVRRTFHYCPFCLKEKKHLNLKWRVSHLQLCDLHQCVLHSGCPACKKIITWSNLDSFEYCPYCRGSLYLYQTNETPITAQDLWNSRSWDYLLSPTTSSLLGTESGIRLVFLLNECKDIFDRKLVENNYASIGKIHNLLQYARGSWSYNRIINIEPLFLTLYQLQTPVETFFNLAIPNSFSESLTKRSPFRHNPSGNYGNRINNIELREKLTSLCEKLFDMDILITQKVISNELKISENTLQKLGYIPYIHEIKKKQQEKIKQKRIAKMIETIDQFFLETKEKKVLAMHVYEYLGVHQSYLCDYAPEINKYIETKRIQNNMTY